MSLQNFVEIKRAILSSDFVVHAKTEHTCEVCGMPIAKGESCYSYGYADRKECKRKRMWLCANCDIDSPSDQQQFIKDWLRENRFIEEIW